MTPTQLAAVTLIVIAGIGLLAAVLVGPLLRRRPGGTDPGVVRARALSYAVLAGILALAVVVGLPALTILLAAIAAIALVEWSRLTDLPDPPPRGPRGREPGDHGRGRAAWRPGRRPARRRSRARRGALPGRSIRHDSGDPRLRHRRRRA